MTGPKPWIGVDFDETLATYNPIDGELGTPIAQMVDRVKAWLAKGVEVKIVTARVSHLCFQVNRLPTDSHYGEAYVLKLSEEQKKLLDYSFRQKELIEAWCELHLGKKLPVVATKDYNMVQLWDDRAVSVNKGEAVCFDEHGCVVTV